MTAPSPLKLPEQEVGPRCVSAAVQGRHPAAPLGITDDHFRSIWVSALQWISKSLAQPSPWKQPLSTVSWGGSMPTHLAKKPQAGGRGCWGRGDLQLQGASCARLTSTRRRRGSAGVRGVCEPHPEPRAPGQRTAGPGAPAGGRPPCWAQLCSGGMPWPGPKGEGCSALCALRMQGPPSRRPGLSRQDLCPQQRLWVSSSGWGHGLRQQSTAPRGRGRGCPFLWAPARGGRAR